MMWPQTVEPARAQLWSKDRRTWGRGGWDAGEREESGWDAGEREEREESGEDDVCACNMRGKQAESCACAS
jgi:hypothetical protein